jgi:Contractile injection system tube protein
MGETSDLVKARLVELDASFKKPAPGGLEVEVQFNPDTLKVTYQNKSQEQKSAGDQRGNSPRQVIGAGSTKLALQLWFDVNAPGAGGARDVRTLTSKVARFMVPASPSGAGSKADRPSPPGVRFTWGTFGFDGLMDSLDETLDYFSPDGRPLRATLSIGMSGQLEIVPPSGGGNGGNAAVGPTPGTRPLSAASAGSSLPGLALGAGVAADWQAIATANGIDNPRLLTPGTLLDLDVSVSGGLGGGVGLR